MAVYVDDANIPATVGRHNSTWSHLTADTQEELHEFAARLGLKRSYFQLGTPRGDGTPSPFWHYDVTQGMRAKAIRLGARSTPWREMPDIMKAREAGLARGVSQHQPDATQEQAAQARRLLVTGSRDWTDEAAIREALRPRFSADTILVAGGARGADKIAARIWRERGGQVEEHKVTAGAWKQGKGAGLARNARMVQAGADECVAFIKDGSPGASHCAALAENAGISVERHEVTTAKATHAEAARRHWWQATANRDQKQCANCGTVAIRRMHPTERRWLTTYHRDGQMVVAARVPACGEPLKGTELSPEERSKLADEAARAAGYTYRGGDTDRAGRLLQDARVLAPGRAGLWDQRERRVREAARNRGPQGAARAGLAQQTEARLEAAGIQPDDPGLTAIRTWNSGLQPGPCDWPTCREHGRNAEKDKEATA